MISTGYMRAARVLLRLLEWISLAQVYAAAAGFVNQNAPGVSSGLLGEIGLEIFNWFDRCRVNSAQDGQIIRNKITQQNQR